jgi:opacity protein-like surface antigen
MKKAVVLALAAIMVLGVAAAAFADQAVYSDNAAPNASTSGVVNVSATVNPKITLTIDTPDAGQYVAFGAVDPGATYGPLTVGLTVDSNKKFDLTSTQDTTGFGALTLGRTLADVSGHAKGAGITFSDDYGITVPIDADPGDYSATVTYSVVQTN